MKGTRLKRTYSSREVAAITGLSARQLQLWDATGLVPPAMRPHRTAAGGYTERRYSPIDVFEIAVLAELRSRGFTVHQLQDIVRVLKDQFGTRLFDATGGSGHIQLLTDNREVYARTQNGDVFNLLRTPTQPLLVLSEAGMLKELSGRIRPRRPARRTPRHAAGEA